MKHIPTDGEEYQDKLREWNLARVTKNDAYHAIWGCCRCIAACVAENDKMLHGGIRLSDVGKLAEIDKRIYGHIAEAGKHLKLYKACRKRVKALTEQYGFIP